MSATAAPKTLAISAADYFEAKLAYEITPWTLNGLLEKGTPSLFVLDVRDDAQYEAGHIPTAKHVALADLPAKLATLPRDKTIVPYCGNLLCSLAPKAALELARAGFTVRYLVGGVEEWTKKGFKLDKN